MYGEIASQYWNYICRYIKLLIYAGTTVLPTVFASYTLHDTCIIVSQLTTYLERLSHILYAWIVYCKIEHLITIVHIYSIFIFYEHYFCFFLNIHTHAFSFPLFLHHYCFHKYLTCSNSLANSLLIIYINILKLIILYITKKVAATR